MDPVSFHPDEQVMGVGNSGADRCLRVVPLRYESGQQVLVSAWKPTQAELDRLNAGGRVYVGIMMPMQPPVSLVTNPLDLGLTGVLEDAEFLHPPSLPI